MDPSQATVSWVSHRMGYHSPVIVTITSKFVAVMNGLRLVKMLSMHGQYNDRMCYSVRQSPMIQPLRSAVVMFHYSNKILPPNLNIKEHRRTG
jgi:hypothetical protein